MFVAYQVQVLDRRGVVAEYGAQVSGLGDVAIEVVDQIVRQHDNLEIARVDRVGQ